MSSRLDAALTDEQRNLLKQRRVTLEVDPEGFIRARTPAGSQSSALTPRRAIELLQSTA